MNALKLIVLDFPPAQENSTGDHGEYDKDDWEDELEGSMIDFGLLFGLRFPVSETIFLNGTYYLGIAQLTTNDDNDQKNKGLQLYLSFIL